MGYDADGSDHRCSCLELGLFIGRNDSNPIKRMAGEDDSKNVGTDRQLEETQRKPDVSQASEPPQTAEVVQYTVQVGSFSSYQNAAAMVNSLRGDGHTCWIGTELSSDSDTTQKFYPVFVGRFRTKEAGDQIGKVLVRRLPSITRYMVREIKE